MRKNRIKLATVIVTIFTTAVLPSSAEAGSVKSIKYNCELKVDLAHLSEDAKKKGRGDAVKVKAKTICDQYQNKTQIFMTIYKEGLFINHASKAFPLTTEKKFGFIVEHKTAELPCVNGKLTKFYGKATAIIKIGTDVIKLGPAYSDKKNPLCCGT